MAALRRPRKPDTAMTVKRYQDLTPYIQAFVDGHLGLLMIVGTAGLQKSVLVRDTVGPAVCWLTGHVTAFRLYCAAYHHRGRPLVVDDVDDLYADPAAVRILKCLCQTDPAKKVAWHS